MMIKTALGEEFDSILLRNYLTNLVNMFFKILPMREQNEATLVTYMQSLQRELFGCKGFIIEIGCDHSFVSLLCILQFLIDNPYCPVADVKREVFRAISLCNRLKQRNCK